MSLSDEYCNEEKECMEILTPNGRRVKLCEKHRALAEKLATVERDHKARMAMVEHDVEQLEQQLAAAQQRVRELEEKYGT